MRNSIKSPFYKNELIISIFILFYKSHGGSTFGAGSVFGGSGKVPSQEEMEAAEFQGLKILNFRLFF